MCPSLLISAPNDFIVITEYESQYKDNKKSARVETMATTAGGHAFDPCGKKLMEYKTVDDSARSRRMGGPSQ